MSDAKYVCPGCGHRYNPDIPFMCTSRGPVDVPASAFYWWEQTRCGHNCAEAVLEALRQALSTISDVKSVLELENQLTAELTNFTYRCPECGATGEHTGYGRVSSLVCAVAERDQLKAMNEAQVFRIEGLVSSSERLEARVRELERAIRAIASEAVDGDYASCREIVAIAQQALKEPDRAV